MGRILFGQKFNLGHADVALLAAGSGLFILALTLSQALIALSGHRQAMVAWLIGLLAFLVATEFLSHDLFLRVELGSIAGAGVSAAAMGLFFLNRVEQGRRRPAAWPRSSSRSNTGPSRSSADPFELGGAGDRARVSARACWPDWSTQTDVHLVVRGGTGTSAS